MSAATNISVAPELPPTHTETAEFRRRVSSISRQSAVYFAGTLFTAAAGYLFKIYLARELGAETLGLYALGMSIVGIVSIFNAAGLPTAGARFVAEYSSRNDYSGLGGFLRAGISLLGIGNVVLGALLVAVVPWIAGRIYHAPALGAYSWSFAAIMLLGVLNSFLGQCMAGFRAVARRSIITQFAGTIATIVAAVALIKLHFGLGGYLAAQVAGATLVLACLGYSVWKLTPPAAKSTSGWGHLERRVIAFSATSLGIAAVHFALAHADRITLGYFLNPTQVGIYAVATAMVGVLPIALTSVNQIFSPMIAELHARGDHALLQRLYGSLTKWVLIATVPLALTFGLFSRALMTMFGPGFQGGAAILVVGAIAQLFNCGVGSVGFLLLMSGNQVALMRIQAVNAVLMVILNLLLVPRLGILGAALASGIAVAGTNLWGLVEVRRRLDLFPYNRGYLKLAIPCATTAVVLLAQRSLFGNNSWHVAGAAFVAAYFVFLGSLLMLGVDGDDRMLLRMAWSKFRRILSGEPDEQYA